MASNSYTYKLTKEQQTALLQLMRTANGRPIEVPYTLAALAFEHCRVMLYTSGKCLVQGKGAQEWIQFYLEPNVLGAATLGYEDVLDPEASEPHMGIDESGKGDYFGPLVIAAAYVDAEVLPDVQKLGTVDSKRISSDQKSIQMASALRGILKGRFAVVAIGPEAYNRLYAKMGSVNSMLAWGHARAIENLLEKVPDCPRAIVDQFGPARQVERALMQKGKKLKLVQRPKAESDMAVAAASILARAGFLDALKRQSKQLGFTVPKGASQAVQAAAVKLVETAGASALAQHAKCHFQTTDKVLLTCKQSREAIGPLGQAVSKAARS